MSRRATLPGADELFRRTSDAGEPTASTTAVPIVATHGGDNDAVSSDAVAVEAATVPAGQAPVDTERPPRPAARRRSRAGERRPTGRERHDEKITVYVSPEELVDLERAKLALRATHGLAVDRGRIVREAIAMVIADLETAGDDSLLVRRLRGQ
jgi:hypothetical protein